MMPSRTSVPDRIARVAQGVRARGVQLGPPLSEAEIHRFEKRHGIRLPEDYRAFLSHVGNGGPGPPAYGLAALGEVASDMRAHQARTWTDLPHVRKLFPFTKPWVWEGGEQSDQGTSEQVEHGSIYLGNDGCGMYWCLIVNGPERGNVWMICGEGLQPTTPKRAFLRWYADWLDGVRDWWA